jgi:hypothetical protein
MSFMELYDAANAWAIALCQQIAASRVGTYILESTWEFPVIEGTHVIALALSVGMIIWFDLRLLGVTMRHRAISEVSNGIYWWMIGGFTVMFITGGLLFWAEADRAIVSIFFRIKIIALLFAGLNILYFHLSTQRGQPEWDKAPTPPFKVRMAGALSIFMWAVVIAAGRLMAYTF